MNGTGASTVDGRQSRMLTDWALAAAFVALTQIDVWVLADGQPAMTRVLAAALTLVASLVLAFRRRAPFQVFAVAYIAVGAVILLGVPGQVYQFTTLVALYTVAAHERPRPAWSALGLNTAGVVIYFLAFGSGSDLFELPFVVLLFVLGWAAGRAVAARSRERALVEEHARSAALAAADRSRLEHQEARVGIARELHDLIGHTLNVMVVYAGAGRRAIDDDVDDARTALATIEETGRVALDELDQVLGLLRSGTVDGDNVPLPGLDQLEHLEQRFAAAGLPVALTVELDPSEVPRTVALSVYRIAQEALTNTLRHAAASGVSVSVTRQDDVIELVVTDDGSGSTAPAGRGLRGMQERATAHGGSIEHGGLPAGGFQVRALLPIRGGGR